MGKLISSTIENTHLQTQNVVISSVSTPSSPVDGQIYYDSTLKVLHIHNGTEFQSFYQLTSPSGGTITTYTSGGTTYKVHTFLSSGTFFTAKSVSADILLVGGGGGGGTAVQWAAGGGGAGQMVEITGYTIQGFYQVKIGAGGPKGFSAGTQTLMDNNQSGLPGGNTEFGPIVAVGGGGGGQSLHTRIQTSWIHGGSGGGAGPGTAYSTNTEIGAGRVIGKQTHIDSSLYTAYTVSGNIGGIGEVTSGSGGNSPWGGGGGGGAGGVGGGGVNNGGAGGSGKDNNFRTGSNITYAGGGGGSTYNGTRGAAGSGGGGIGSETNGYNAGNGEDGKGGGGGGITEYSVGQATTGNGGSGIVVIRYAI